LIEFHEHCLSLQFSQKLVYIVPEEPCRISHFGADIIAQKASWRRGGSEHPGGGEVQNELGYVFFYIIESREIRHGCLKNEFVMFRYFI
jgi:hypothetical protein